MDRLLRLSTFLLTYLLVAESGIAQQYRVDTLASNPNIAFPVAMVFTPDASGKFFFTEKAAGRVRIYENGQLRPSPFLTVGVTSSGEQGLLGITLHPEYPDSPFVYIFFTRSTSTGGTRDNMVVRYRDSSNVGVDPDTIVIVPRNNAASNHNGGNVHFGPDGKLYITFGEYATSSNSQDTSVGNLRGKILRLNSDGSIPSDNPWSGRAFWSVGHRNSFDFTFDALTGKMYSTENGPSCNDEVNLVPERGNLGWPVDGNCTYSGNPLYVRPLHVFPSTPLPALTGIAVYRQTAFPRLYGKLLFTGNSSPTLWAVTLTADGDTIVPGSFTSFYSYSTGFADVEIGPDGNIYLTNGPYSANRILRLRPVAPSFTTSPILTAVQDSEYVYTPSFGGTPPGLSVLIGPEGMEVDSATWSVRWTPTNAQALQESHSVMLRAENGGGYADQSFVIQVTNVNDPPSSFSLWSPPTDTSLTFTGSDPMVSMSWQEAFDPDLDTLYYYVQIDTLSTFTSPLMQEFAAGVATTHTVTLPRITRSYYWRVRASDGEFSVFSSEYRRFHVTFVTSARETQLPPEEKGEYLLDQNFPNPFNPTTSITYTLAKNGHVRLSVFNLLGQEVAVIYDGTQSAGQYEFEFDRGELPSGIYFYRLRASDFLQTRKMIIAK